MLWRMILSSFLCLVSVNPVVAQRDYPSECGCSGRGCYIDDEACERAMNQKARIAQESIRELEIVGRKLRIEDCHHLGKRCWEHWSQIDMAGNKVSFKFIQRLSVVCIC